MHVQDARVGGGRRWWLVLLTAAVLLFLMLPSLIVVPMSFSDSTFLEFPPRALSLRWYENYVETPEWRRATWVSLQVACLAVVIAVPTGTAAAYALHVAEIRGKALLAALMVAPMLVPHILIAVGLFFAFNAAGLRNTLLGLALAHGMLTIPFVFVLVSAGLRNHDLITERAARSLGASWTVAFFTVTLPQIRHSVIFSAVICFITSLDEVIIALFLATGTLSTLTRRMFLSLRDAIDPTIAAISTILICFSVLVVLVALVTGQAGSGDRR
jgi:putative spermidine/putrescine transport system permease protein